MLSLLCVSNVHLCCNGRLNVVSISLTILYFHHWDVWEREEACSHWPIDILHSLLLQLSLSVFHFLLKSSYVVEQVHHVVLLVLVEEIPHVVGNRGTTIIHLLRQNPSLPPPLLTIDPTQHSIDSDPRHLGVRSPCLSYRSLCNKNI